jgi:hypothetical protein
LPTYAEIRAAIGNSRSHLLLGNGFSIACDPIYSYANLYEFAEPHFNERVRRVFDYLGTNNFEGVMRLLLDGSWLAGEYGAAHAAGEITGDLTVVKTALVEAVANNQLQRPTEVGDARLDRCVQFLVPYQNVFTVCYDLLLYWVAVRGLTVLKERDGFRDSPDDSDAIYCVFQEHVGGQRGIFFIHGALHIYVQDGEVRKHTWTKSGVPLVVGIRDGLDHDQWPLFVAEGNHFKKREQILGNGYLDYCFSKFCRIESPLVTFGFSFGDTDRHITSAIVHAVKVQNLYVGLHEPGSLGANATRAAAERLVHEREQFTRMHGITNRELTVTFFDAATCPVW